MGEHPGPRDVDVVPFSGVWMEGLLDLLESEGVADPLYGSTSTRDEQRARVQSRIASGLTQAMFVALRGGRVVGCAFASRPALCGGGERDMAWLSVTVALDDIGQGIGARLVERVSAEMKAQGVRLLRIGMLDGWGDWCAFLRRCGFERNERERTADAVLPPDAPVPDAAPGTNAVLRPIRLPEERPKVIAFSTREMAEHLPWSCAPEVGGAAWWEHWPAFDASGFLIAMDRATEDLVGYVCPVVVRDARGVHGIIDGMDVAKPLAETGLRERLVLHAIRWLRGRGVRDVRCRVHVGYKDEQGVFERLGFRLENAAAVWYKPTR